MTSQPLPLRWRLRRAWHRLRNRLLTQPRFQREAMRWPIGRQIGRSRALALHHITAGFVYSQVLAACVDLDLFSRIGLASRSTDWLADHCKLPVEGMQRLLLAAQSLGLLERYPDDTWSLGELGAAMLANPGLAPMVRHHQHLYRDLLDPVQLLSTRGPTHLSAFWPYALGDREGEGSETYSELMATSQAMIADHVLDACRLDRCGHLVDVAGGHGAFARAALARHPALRATVLDLPAVAARAAAQSTENRLTFQGVDMFRDPLPQDADVVTLIRILHDHDDQPVIDLLAHLHKAMPEGSKLVIAEPLAETPGAAPIGNAYFGIYLWAMGSGRPRSLALLRQLLAGAGFTDIRERPSNMPCLVRVIEATRKA